MRAHQLSSENGFLVLLVTVIRNIDNYSDTTAHCSLVILLSDNVSPDGDSGALCSTKRKVTEATLQPLILPNSKPLTLSPTHSRITLRLQRAVLLLLAFQLVWIICVHLL